MLGGIYDFHSLLLVSWPPIFAFFFLFLFMADNIYTKHEDKKKMNKKVYKNIKISTCITLIKKCVQDINIWRCIYSLLQINKK